MRNEELNLTQEETETYFRIESEIDKYNDAIDAMIELVDNDLFPKSLGREVLAKLNSLRTNKDSELEELQAK